MLLTISSRLTAHSAGGFALMNKLLMIAVISIHRGALIRNNDPSKAHAIRTSICHQERADRAVGDPVAFIEALWQVHSLGDVSLIRQGNDIVSMSSCFSFSLGSWTCRFLIRLFCSDTARDGFPPNCSATPRLQLLCVGTVVSSLACIGEVLHTMS